MGKMMVGLTWTRFHLFHIPQNNPRYRETDITRLLSHFLGDFLQTQKSRHRASSMSCVLTVPNSIPKLLENNAVPLLGRRINFGTENHHTAYVWPKKNIWMRRKTNGSSYLNTVTAAQRLQNTQEQVKFPQCFTQQREVTSFIWPLQLRWGKVEFDFLSS